MLMRKDAKLNRERITVVARRLIATQGADVSMEAIAERLFVPKADDAEFERVWNEVFPVYFAHPERVDFAALPKTPFTSAAFNATLRILPNADVLARLTEIRVPTLVIGATQDWTFPPPVGARRIHERIPGSDYVEFAESGHYPFIEEHEPFVAAVGDWLLAHRPDGEPMSAFAARELLAGVGLTVPAAEFPVVALEELPAELAAELRLGDVKVMVRPNG